MKKGLWANIHAKRKRIKAGSGERMRKPGSKGAPTDQDFKDAAEETTLDIIKRVLSESKWKYYDKKKGGMTRAGVAKYRRENPGSKLKMAVTTKPSKLKKDSKAYNRRKSFCARMSGVEGPMKDEKGRPTRKALALRKWNC
jgi:hypothetical protein